MSSKIDTNRYVGSGDPEFNKICEGLIDLIKEKFNESNQEGEDLSR